MARLGWPSEPVIVIQCFLSIILLTFHFASAGPTGQRAFPQCLSFCKEAKNFVYETGTTYVYDYATDIETSIIEGSQHKSHVRVTARAELETLSTCNFKLQLKNVRFEDLTTGSSEYTRLDSFRTQESQLERHSLLFGLQDGKVEQVCAHQDDDIWIVNVKRGVVSMMQNSLEDLSSSSFIHETDINGKCPTDYTVAGTVWGGGVSIKKFKDLTKCNSRQTQLSAIQSVPYSSSSPVQNIPLLTGKVECSQTIRNSRIESVQCEEEQRFQPFEEENSGAVTKIAQSLSYVSEYTAQRHNDESGIFVKKSLLFEAEEPADGTLDNSKQMLQFIENLEMASFPQVTPAAPQLFSDFVIELRSSTEASIRKVYEAVLGTSKVKYLMEAMPLVGTASSLAFLGDLTIKDSLDTAAQKSWLTSLAFIKHPTVEMIKAVTPLLELSSPPMEAFLGISSLVNSYCKYHPSCNEQVVVNDILEKITAPLGSDCHLEDPSAVNIRLMVLRLKAIGNAGVLPVAEQVGRTPIVIRCLQDKNNPINVRLGALDSLRRLPCQLNDREDVLQQFSDVHENTEIRIKAFLALMRCVNRNTMELIKSMLTTEPVNQVGSFVWTFLTNLQETNRPEKQEIRDLVSNEFLKSKFSTDARKFSRNYEASSYWQELNVGAGLDSNIIFTEESFLPKSGMLNLTVQLFGESVNIFEFGVRTHGMEQILEKLFGPQGYLPDNRVTDFLNAHNRAKRDTSAVENTDGLGYLYDQANMDGEVTPGGSFYTRMFGNEIIYKQFEVSDNTAIPNVVDESGNSWFNIRHILDNLSTGKKSEFSKSMILLDTSYSVATCAGFPLSLSVHAAATLAMVAKGRINVGRFIETKVLDLQGTLKPSTMINVDGTMAIKIGGNSKTLQTGLKLHNTLRSSTAVELSLLMRGKNVFQASLNVPQAKQEIIDISSQLVAIGPNGQAPITENSGETFDATAAPPLNSDYLSNGCSAQYLTDLTGMKICLQMNIPNKMSFTPVRPVYLKLYLEKADDFTGYTIDYRYDSDSSTTTLNAVFDTPGSLVNRRISADFLLDRGMGKIAAALESASTALRAEGIYTRFQKNLELSLVSQEKTSFLLSTGLRSDGNIVKPHFLITWHARPLVDLKGTIDMTPQSGNEEKMIIEMNLKHLTETPVKVTGEIIGTGEVKEATLAVESYILTGNIRSQLKRKPEHWSTKTSMEYSWKRGKVHTADLSSKFQRTRKGSLSKALITAGFSSTQFPENSAEFYWETQTSSGFCENTLKVGWGKTGWEGHTLFSRQNHADHRELRVESSLLCSKFNINYRVEFAHRETTEGFKTKVLGRTATDNEFNANVEYISAVDDLLRKSLDASATWPNTDYNLKASFIEKQRGDFEAELLVHLNSTRDLKATGFYINRSNNLRLDHNLEFRARGFTPVPFSGSLGFSATEKQSHVGLQVQFEGKKPYSSRMSTSLDYSHTKYSHKLEGKVTLNERKYNGAVSYINNPHGGKNLTVDLQLENHIYVEATLKGMLPEPMLATLLVIPDKDNEPDSKVKLEGNVDPNSIALMVDYFGDEVSVGGWYDDSSVIAELIWPQNQKFMVSIAIPRLSFGDAQIDLDVVTPFDGYNTITFTVQHLFADAKLKTSAKGSIEDTDGSWNFAASFAPNEVTVATDMALTGYPNYEGNFLLLRKAKRKSFQLSMKAGEKESLINLDFIRLEEGYVGKFDFYGCPFFPKVSLEINHQFSASRVSNYNSKIQWGEDFDTEQKLVLQVKHQNHPLTFEGLFTSPWSPMKLVETSFIWNVDERKHKFSLAVKENANQVNAKFQLNAVGSRENFSHELDAEWFAKTMRVTVSGALNGLTNSNMHAIVKLPEHQVSYDFLSKEEPQKYLGEFKANVDGAITAAGVNWNFGGEGFQEKTATVWGQIPRYLPLSATLELINTNGKRTTKLKINRKDTTVIDVISVIQFAGLKHWDVDFAVKSTCTFVPSISFASKHNLLNLNELRHATTLLLVPVNEERFWLKRYTEARRATVDLIIDNLQDIKGALIFGPYDFVVTGKIETGANNKGYSSTIQIASNNFHTMKLQGTYLNEENELSVSGEVFGNDGSSVMKLQLDAMKQGAEKTGTVSWKSSYTPSLKGFVAFSTLNSFNFTTYVLKNTESFFNFNTNGLMSATTGLLQAKLSSDIFPSVSNLQLDLNYAFAKSSVGGRVRFQDNTEIITASLESAWGDHIKTVKGSFDGTLQVSFEAALEGMTQLVAHVIYNGVKLGEISISYRPEQSDFSLGKHGVYIAFTDKSGIIQNFNIVVGLDSRRIHVNVQTPFTNWTNVMVDGQVGSSSTAKEIKFLLQREQESIQGSFESRNSRKTGLRLFADLSVVGFSKLRHLLLETAQATDIRGLDAVNPQKFTFQLNWSTSNAEVNVETPVDVLKRLSFSGNWELKKPEKFVVVTGQLNEEEYDLKVNVHHDESNCKGKLMLTSDNYAVQFDYDLTNDYEANLSIETPNQQWNVGGKIIMKPNLMGFEVTTPFKNFESVAITAQQELPSDNEKKYTLSWNVNGKSDKIELRYEFDQGRLELRASTPFVPWNSVVVTVIYDTPFKHFTFHSQRGDGQEVKINFQMDASGNLTTFESPATSSIHVAIETPMENFEDIKFSLLYNRKNLVHTANVSVARNDGETEGKLNLMFQHSDPVALDISAFLTSPLLASKATAHASLLVDPNGESTVSAHVQASGKRYEMYGLSQFTSTITKLEMRTSLPFLRQVKFSVKKAATINMHGAWTGNNKHVEVHGDVLCKGFRSSRISFNVSTPTDLMGSFGFDGEVASKAGVTNAKVVFQNHEVRWLAKVDGVQEQGIEDWRLQVNTPLVGYKHVVVSVKHSVNDKERNVVALIQINKKEMSMRLGSKQKQLDIVLGSELAYLPVQAKINANWKHALMLAISTTTGNNEYGTSFNLNLQGMSRGNINFAISSMEHLNSVVDWKLEGDGYEGQAWLNVKNSLVGRKSIRTSWRNQNWQDAVFDIWIKTGMDEEEKGITIQYAVTPYATYGSIIAKANYTLSTEDNMKTILFEGSLDNQPSLINFDSVLKTPFADFEIFQTKGQIKIKDNEIGFSLHANVSDDKLISSNMELMVKPLHSTLSVKLDIPSITDSIELSVSYDMTTSVKAVALIFKQNIYVMNLKLDVTIPNGSSLVDVNLLAESTVPMVPLDVSGVLRMEYVVNSDATRQISLHLTGNEVGEWKLLASVRPTSNLNVKVVFEGPPDMVPSFMTEFSFAGNLKDGISSEAAFIMDDTELTANLLIDQTQWRSSFKYLVTDTHHYAGDAQFSFNDDGTQLDIKYNDGESYNVHASGYLNVTSEAHLGSGTVTVTSGTTTVVPISIEVLIENSGNMLIIGTSNESNFRLEANLKGNNGMSWLKDGESSLKVEGNLFGDDTLSLEVQSTHFFRDHEFSVNVTAADSFKLESYVSTQSNAVLFSKIDLLDQEVLNMNVKLLPSTVDAFLHIPAYMRGHLVADYGSSATTTYTNAVLLLNGEKSVLNASLTRNDPQVVCKAFLEIPQVKQRIDVEITTVFSEKQNLKGDLKLKVNDQEIEISGALKTHGFDLDGQTYVHRVLEISSNITSTDVTTIGLELSIRKPLINFSDLNVVATLSINDQLSTLSGGYKLPTTSKLPFGAEISAKFQSSYLPPDEDYDFFLMVFDKSLKKVAGKLNYKVTEFNILWDFLTTTSTTTVSYSSKSDDGERLLVQIENIVDLSQNANLTINCHGWDTHYNFRTSLTRQNTTLTGHLFIDAPHILATTNEYKIIVTTNEDGSYGLEASVVRGRLIMELVGEVSIRGNTTYPSINMMAKAMGSYGSHYAMVIGNGNGNGQYGFEMTAESSTLFVGKRVNVRGNMTIDERRISTVLQCRARRNIHELSVVWRKEDNGAGKLSIGLTSPSVDPAKVTAEWLSRGKLYTGKLSILVFQKNHEANVILNLKDFEGKLHIVSPLLPSNEFNFHVKSIVNSRNVDLMGDIRIRGSHWRLEGVAAFIALRNMEFKLEARTPFAFFDRLTLGLKCVQDEVYLEIHTPASYIPDVLFKLGGLGGLKNGQWYKLKPRLSVSVPNGKYTLIADLETPGYDSKGTVFVQLEYTGKETQKELKVFAEVSPLKSFKLQMENPGYLEVKLETPFEILSRVNLFVEGEINMKRSGKLRVLGALNSHEGVFDASFDNSNDNMQAVTRLMTNVPSYEKTAFAIAIQTFQGIGKGKSFHVEFIKPDWENLFRLDADYRYNFEDFINLEGEVNVNMDSYMNLPALHGKVTSVLKDRRYSGALEGKFGTYQPALKLEGEYLDEKMTVFVEGKAGKNDRYNVLNTLEMVRLQSEFSFKENLRWGEEEVLDMQVFLSEPAQFCEAHLHLYTPWGPVNSKAALSPITFLTMNDDLSVAQLLKNTNATLDVKFMEKKILGLEIVSRDGMRVLEIHNPLRPVSLSMAVEKIDWNALRLRVRVCWDLKAPERSSLGLDAYLYRRSTGLSIGGFLAGGSYGIMTLMFDHFFVSSKLSQNLMIKWNAHAGRMGDLGYTLNFTDKTTGSKRVIDYGLRLVVPSRSVTLSGNTESADNKYLMSNLAIAWDALRNPEKVIKFNFTSQNSTTWRTRSISRTFDVRHVSWTEPMVFSMDKTLVHDVLKDIGVKVELSSNPSSHLFWSALWENGDWSSLVTKLVQPSSKIDIEAKYNLTEQLKMIKLTHMLATGDYKLFSANLERNENLQTLVIKSGDVSKPRTLSSLSLQSANKEHSVKAVLLQYQITGLVRTSLPYLDLVLRQDNANKVQIICGLPHSKEIVFKASRSQFTKTINDVSFLLRLNSSNIISTRLHWRPDFLDEISEYDWLKGSKSLLATMLPSFVEVSSSFRAELEGHWVLFSVPVKQFLTTFYQFSAAEVNIIFQELQLVSSRIQQLYARNAFYLKDIVEVIKASVSPLVKVVKNAILQVKDACKTLCGYMMNIGTTVSNFVVKYYGRLELHVMQAWEDVEQLVVRVWSNNAAWIQMVSEELEEFIDALIEALEGKIEMLEEKLMAVGFVKTALQLYRDYATWLDEIPLDDYVEAVEEFFQIKVWDKLETLFGPYIEAIRNALDDDYIKELLETPPIPYIRFVLKQMKNGLVKLWDVIELEEKAKDLIRHALKSLDGLAQRNFPSWQLEWDVDNGVIEYDQSLSFIEWVDFTQGPRWRIHSQEAEEVNQLANFYYQVVGYIETMRPIFDMRIRDVLPPFSGLAMMAGDHHYYTFDKKYFRFAGECSYVLVADLLHNGFSFIVNYETRDGAIRKKSYTIALTNHNIEFDVANFKVTVDNRKVELPTKVETVYIRRQETRLDIYDVRGYQITCTLSPSVCTFSTSGWYYGKLAGLLGTYDNELINDFRSPDGETISDIPTFAYSWRVGKGRNQCRMKNFARDETEPVDVDNICYNLLVSRNSPLRPCFNTVDTTIFMEMCKYDVSKNINSASRTQTACTSMSAYVTECQKHNVDVWMPPTCVRCKLEDGTALTTGENATLQTNDVSSKPPLSSDVVILLEEGNCMDQMDIHGAISKLEATLRAEGITDNRYALVGYGGQGIHHEAHVQTASAKVWSHSTLFKVPDKSNVAGTKKSDLYSAIHYASMMTYRAGVSKTLIAITCGDEKCGDSVRYADTLTLLVENDFRLHMITPKPFTLKGKKKQDEANRILGFDATGVYTVQHAKRTPLVADPSFKRHLNFPKDLCTPLAVETNGTRFSSDNLNKKALDVWARRVAQTSQPSECQRCECVPDKNGGSRLMCHQCVSPSLWKFMEEWKNYQSQEVDDVFGLEILESEPFLLPPN